MPPSCATRGTGRGRALLKLKFKSLGDTRMPRGEESIFARNQRGNGKTPGHGSEPDLEVLHLRRRPPPALPIAVFGELWGEWINEAREAAACPPDYVAMPLLALASVLLGNARW